jgi:hypothetical protein
MDEIITKYKLDKSKFDYIEKVWFDGLLKDRKNKIIDMFDFDMFAAYKRNYQFIKFFENNFNIKVLPFEDQCIIIDTFFNYIKCKFNESLDARFTKKYTIEYNNVFQSFDNKSEIKTDYELLTTYKITPTLYEDGEVITINKLDDIKKENTFYRIINYDTVYNKLNKKYMYPFKKFQHKNNNYKCLNTYYNFSEINTKDLTQMLLYVDNKNIPTLVNLQYVDRIKGIIYLFEDDDDKNTILQLIKALKITIPIIMIKSGSDFDEKINNEILDLLV